MNHSESGIHKLEMRENKYSRISTRALLLEQQNSILTKKETTRIEPVD